MRCRETIAHMKTTAEIILQALAKWGVKNIYGVSGDAILPFMDALGKQQEISFFSTATEAGAAFMACGEARITGKPGLCLATEGPGALNLLNGVADAYRDDIPLLILTGQVETAKLDTNSKQYLNLQQLFAPVTGLTTLLTRPESTIGVFKLALEKVIGDSTPCHIAIPKDIFLSPTLDTAIPPLGQPMPPGRTGDLKKTASLLKNCQKPILISGRTAIPYKDQVLQLANLLGAGIIPAQGARGIYPSSEARLLGGLGEAHIPPLLNEANCILLLGDCPYEHNYLPAKVPIIQIDTKPQNLARQLNPVALTGDVDFILRDLITELASFQPNPNWQQAIAQGHTQYTQMIQAEATLQLKPISPRQVIALLNDLLPENAVITLDVGEFMHWFDRGLLPRQQQVIISDYWRCMGCGLPYGLGVQVACPEKKVVVLMGDGDFLMTLQELLTAVRYALPVVILIFNNGCYSLEQHRMQKMGLTPFGTDVAALDIAKYAEACGAVGMRVAEPAELADTLRKAMDLDKPTVVDIIVDRDRPAFI